MQWMRTRRFASSMRTTCTVRFARRSRSAHLEPTGGYCCEVESMEGANITVIESEHHFHFGAAFAREQVDGDARVVPAQHQVDARLADRQALHRHPVDELRQARPAQAHFARAAIDLQAEARL